jgi:4-hydroxy-3-polyprenylbenzoate decarboxylase
MSVSTPQPNAAFHLSYEDLREWITEADRLGELRIVKGASWQEEIGMAATLVSHSDNAPALLFDEVPGCSKGFRVLVNLFGGKRKNMSLGFADTDFDKVELSEAFAEVYPNGIELIPPVEIDNGPIFENIMLGDDVDLEIFPTPKWHKSYHVTRDPHTGWINLGSHRIMIYDSKTVGHNLQPGRHAGYHQEKYVARGERMPMVMVIGGDPMTFFMGGADVPLGVSEFDMVGGLRGAPVEVVRGKVTGLPIPANAEIALEGYVDMERNEIEGPFGDWTGTYTEKGRRNPVVDVKAVYYRNDPIVLGFSPQSLPDEYSRFRAITRSPTLKANMEKAGVPDVKAVWCHEVGGSRMLLAVAITQRYPGHATQAGHVASMCQAGNNANRWVIVTDDDIDVTNLEEVIWAALTRADPATSIDLITGGKGARSDPRLAPWDRASGNIVNSRLIIDACKPFHWRSDFPDVNKPSPEDSRKAREKFGYLME